MRDLRSGDTADNLCGRDVKDLEIRV